MSMDRRNFLKISAGVAGAALASASCSSSGTKKEVDSDFFPELHPMTGDVVPISDEERAGRIEKARRLMGENGIQAIYLEGGTSLFYFTGVRWWNSERMFALVIPAQGEIAWVCPAFEEDRARELIRFGKDIRTWEEHESPYKRIAEIFKDRGIGDGRIGLDGHEWIYLVKGNKRPMEPGMCFTDEPMLVIPGEFGVRLEDDFYITKDGPKFFTTPSPSIDQPFA